VEASHIDLLAKCVWRTLWLYGSAGESLLLLALPEAGNHSEVKVIVWHVASIQKSMGDSSLCEARVLSLQVSLKLGHGTQLSHP